MNKHNEKKSESKFNVFFSKYFYFGIISILFSVILHNCIQPIIPINFVQQIINILSDLICTVGIALTIGSIFDMSKNTSTFTEYISIILHNIIISKTFLNSLDSTGKRNVLELVLKPSGDQIKQQTGIEDYFNKKINESMNMFDTNFKTNLVINLHAKKSSSGKIEVVGYMSNRIHKIQNEFKPIITLFERQDSKMINQRIIAPDGEYTIKKSDCTQKEINEAGIKYDCWEVKIPSEFEKYTSLTIVKELSEIGFDHWTNFHWTSLTPCDGIYFSLVCCDNLSIKEHVIFDDKKSYNITLSEDKKEISIISTSWLDAFTGFTMTISEDNKPLEN